MTVATSWFPSLNSIVNNTGGGVESLPGNNVNGGKEAVYGGTLTLAAQASGSVIGVARIPLGSVITGITVVTDTSLGSATIALGDVNTANAYMTASTFTSTNTPTRVGQATAHMSPILTGYSSVTGSKSTDNTEDVVMTTAAASLPASGNLTIIIECIPGY